MVLYDELKHDKPDYLLSDSVDIGSDQSEMLSFVVASDEEADLGRISKRVREAGKTYGVTIRMPPFTIEELLNIKRPDMTNEEAMFRGAVFGGSARNFVATGITETSILKVVEETLILFFTLDYKSKFSKSWQNIAFTLCKCVR